jgi:hypothetical protein
MPIPRAAPGAMAEGARGHEAGQAQLELIAGIPILLAAGLIALQLLAVGLSQSLADGAAEAGALALVAGHEAEPAVRAALPGWAGDRVRTAASRGSVSVVLRPPSPIPGLSRHLEVSSRAWVRAPAGSGALAAEP